MPWTPTGRQEKAQELFRRRSADRGAGEAGRRRAGEGGLRTLRRSRVRNTLVAIHKTNEQVIDTVSSDDVVIEAGCDAQAPEKARTIVDTFRQFIEENKDEI